MTVLQVIQRSTQFLAARGVDSPRLQVELLLSHVLQLPRLKLYLEFERVLTQPELDSLRSMLRRRAGREPLQHILGTACFCGLELVVNPHVLIPRPETELLAELGWQFLERLNTTAPVVIDVGAGSGCVGIAVALHCARAVVHAIDLSEAALQVAQENALRNGAAERIVFHLGDAFQPLRPGFKAHLILSNPPYIPSQAIAGLQPEVRQFDPHLALDGGPDGLKMIRRLAQEAGPFLLPEGWCMLEFGDGQESAARDIFEAEGWRIQAIHKDYSGRPRILVASR